ncbi:hypothetical protein [Qipengyuania atrilutea]|nr:hypothetical protein [Actirhodobacter atriluteus]
MYRKFVVAFSLAAVSLSLSACNTVRGFGQDITSVADAVDEET